MTYKKIIFFTNLFISVSILTFLSFERYDILSDIVNFLNSIQVYPTLFSINYLDIIIIAFIPLWTMPLYIRFNKITVQRIVLTNAIIFLGLILILITSYFFGDMFGPKLSPLIPKYVLNVPFNNYQTFSLLLGFIGTFIVFYIYSFLKTKCERHLK
jgi:hypothetical protein